MSLYGYPVWNGSILVTGADSIDEFMDFINETFTDSYNPDGFMYWFGKEKDNCPFSNEIEAEHYVLLQGLELDPVESISFLCDVYNVSLVSSFNELQRMANTMRNSSNDEDDLTIEELMKLGRI